MNDSQILNKRLITRIVIEAKTPLTIGSGEKDIMSDKLVARDANNMPYIPGSSIAGVLRHAIGDFNIPDSLFGFQKKNSGMGSRILFTDAVMLGENGRALDGLQQVPDSTFYERYRNLPIRQHVRMGHTGTAEEKGKFDEQVVYKGTRFVFEIEMLFRDEKDKETYNELLKKLNQKTFRIGSGTRNGFGKLKVVSYKSACLDLSKEEQMELYLAKPSCLYAEWSAFKEVIVESDSDTEWEKIEVCLQPKDFFLFGAGFGDDEADMIPVTEPILSWENGLPSFIDDGMVIPGTSVKGALSHRITYYWHKKTGVFADKPETLEKKINVVTQLFGKAADDNSEDDGTTTMGNVIIDDVIIPTTPTRIINHVAIDRFTGGALNGAFFKEKVSDSKVGYTPKVKLNIYIRKSSLDDETVRYSWENALKDLCTGLLPLGGGTNRGNGIFEGEIKSTES